jgi:hypothetical protein
MTDKCVCPDEVIEKVWEWSDCPKVGHEEGCYVVRCIACGYYSADCQDKIGA